MISMQLSTQQPPGKELRRAEAVEIEWVEYTKKPDRQICKLQPSSPVIDDNQLQELYDSLPRFGPFYIANDEAFMLNLKDSAWQHVLRSSSPNQPETIKAYYTSVLEIEKQARDTYPDGTVDGLNRSQFIWMMIKDGCFILQLALFDLGGSEPLGYPSDHLVFGKQRNTNQIRRWIKSLFFVGNQIPLVVLRVLMSQSFFQRVVFSGKWEQPSNLFRKVLYDLLVLPVLERGSQYDRPANLLQVLSQKLGLKAKDSLQEEPSDLLHGLQMLIIGPGVASTQYKTEMHVPFDIDSYSPSYKIPSATELRQLGVHFKHIIGKGSGGIQFTTNMFRAVLMLPTFVVDDDTELLFQYLISYEISQPLGSNKRDVCSYLQFMSELIRTPEDAKLLKGIIRATAEQRERLPGILNRLATGDTNQNLRLVRLQIGDYSRPPWEKFRNFLSLVLLLTLVQTVYTVLGYYKKP